MLVVRAQSQVNCFVKTQMDKRSVYAQQPFKITFTVLTATWYTAPLDLDNIEIPDAFIIPFDRTMPGMFSVGGKQFAGIQFYFIVFPYKPGDYLVPAINITAETPPAGGFKGQAVKIKTAPQKFVVKAIPENFKEENWFVAKNVFVRES
jgi:hypothetical protein